MLPANPLLAAADWMKLSLYYSQTNIAASEVIARRFLRMSRGMMSAPEAVGMLLEKSTACAAAGEKAAMAVARGSSAVGIATAAITPIRKKTRSNARKLRG